MNTRILHFSKVEHSKSHITKSNSSTVLLKEHNKTSILLVES